MYGSKERYDDTRKRRSWKPSTFLFELPNLLYKDSYLYRPQYVNIQEKLFLKFSRGSTKYSWKNIISMSISKGNVHSSLAQSNTVFIYDWTIHKSIPIVNRNYFLVLFDISKTARLIFGAFRRQSKQNMKLIVAATASFLPHKNNGSQFWIGCYFNFFATHINVFVVKYWLYQMSLLKNIKNIQYLILKRFAWNDLTFHSFLNYYTSWNF